MTDVRIAVDADVEKILVLFTEMHDETDYANYPFTPIKASAAIRRWVSSDDAHVLLAVDGEDIVGAIVGTNNYSWGSDESIVSEQFFFVRKAYRNGGVASKLFEAFMAWASSVAKHVHAGVSSGIGDSAESIYAKFGLYPTGRNFVKHY
jgi:GNAT superfamily N-acetyltransferase